MLALPLWLTRLWEPCERLAEIAVKIRVNNESDTYIATGHNYRGGGGGEGVCVIVIRDVLHPA